ncbi:MAG: PIG-L family deacetylase [Thermoproteota archaeon]|nr:PIG-L family deacetylase [Thermoproteota archaeon]
MQSKSILVFGAHPDDLEIGMGGTIAKLSAMGYEVQSIIATLPNFVKSDTKEGRKTESMLSAKVMGCKPPVFLDLSPDEMIFGRKFISLIDSLVTKYKPDSVFTQWYGDSHQDHQILTKSVISACRDQDNLFMYETTIPGGITENSFRPQLFVDISETIDTKKNALECFESQFLRCGEIWIPAIIGRCSYRGYQINSKYAEAFEVVKVTKW